MRNELDCDPHDHDAILGRYRKRFLAGDNDALLQAVDYCLRAKLVAPQWVATAHAISMRKWHALLVADLGSAFGVRKHKRNQMAAERRRRRLAMIVYETVSIIIEEQQPVIGKKDVLDDTLYELAAKRLGKGFSKTLVKKYYLEMRELKHELFVTELGSPLNPSRLANARN